MEKNCIEIKMQVASCRNVFTIFHAVLVLFDQLEKTFNVEDLKAYDIIIMYVFNDLKCSNNTISLVIFSDFSDSLHKIHRAQGYMWHVCSVYLDSIFHLTSLVLTQKNSE